MPFIMPPNASQASNRTWPNNISQQNDARWRAPYSDASRLLLLGHVGRIGPPGLCIDNDAAAGVRLLGHQGRGDALMRLAQAQALLPAHFLHHTLCKASPSLSLWLGRPAARSAQSARICKPLAIRQGFGILTCMQRVTR